MVDEVWEGVIRWMAMVDKRCMTVDEVDSGVLGGRRWMVLVVGASGVRVRASVWRVFHAPGRLLAEPEVDGRWTRRSTWPRARREHGRLGALPPPPTADAGILEYLTATVDTALEDGDDLAEALGDLLISYELCEDRRLYRCAAFSRSSSAPGAAAAAPSTLLRSLSKWAPSKPTALRISRRC